MWRTLLFLEFLFGCFALMAQDESNPGSASPPDDSRLKKFQVRGYVKEMQSLGFSGQMQELSSTYLIHNRLNTKWMPSEKLSFVLEMRNRLIWGDDVKNIPGYGSLLRNANEKIDLSKIWFSGSSIILHSNLDRLYADLKLKNTGLKLGRQRINWGIASTWNPNDIFNSYNFLDFDYEERPGSDAIRFSANISSFSGLELAASPSNKNAGKVLAAKYFFNSRGYDIQLIAGLFGNRWTMGMGWAGSMGDAGFKGEAQFYSPDPAGRYQFNLCLEGDYVPAGSWYLNGSFLYNHLGMNSPLSNTGDLNFVFTPASLMPTRYNLIATARKEINPLFSASFSLLFAPGTNLLLALPGLRYNLSDNLDADLIWQSFFVETDTFKALNHRCFIRFKYSF
jgi:hypothetical protein